MKKTDINRKQNRCNNTIFSHRASPTNILTSEILGDIWLQNEQVNSRVQIIELRSSDSEKSAQSVNDEKDYFPIPDQQWCYTKQDIEHDYEINKAAREKRRNLNQINTTKGEYGASTNDNEDDYVYAEVFVSGSRDVQDENVVYNQMNCFTILDKHVMNSETSDEEFADIEVINCNDTSPEWESRVNYDSDVIRCPQENEHEKRTVWIYSFKNKHLLSENNYQLVNIPSQDESMNSSIEECQQSSIENNDHRVSSPVPPPFVPRLNLPLTSHLPTLTEVTEPGRKSSSNQTEEDKEPINKVSLRENNWFISEPSTSKEKVEDKSAIKSNIINWMSLSPREKRRKLRNASPINLPSDLINHLPPLNEVSALTEKTEEFKAKKIVEMLTMDEEKCDCGDFAHESRDQSTVTEENMQSASTLNQARSIKSCLERKGSSILDSAKKSVRTIRSNLASAKENLNKSSNEIKIESEFHTPKDRGDLPKHRPRIRINVKPDTSKISDPMENFESNNWIYEEKLIKDDHIRTPQDAKGDRASDALWIRNMALLKPAEWTEYEAIAEADSIPSLHLSMNTDSIEENQTLLRRISKYFKCCKLFCK